MQSGATRAILIRLGQGVPCQEDAGHLRRHHHHDLNVSSRSTFPRVPLVRSPAWALADGGADVQRAASANSGALEAETWERTSQKPSSSRGRGPRVPSPAPRLAGCICSQPYASDPCCGHAGGSKRPRPWPGNRAVGCHAVQVRVSAARRVRRVHRPLGRRGGAGQHDGEPGTPRRAPARGDRPGVTLDDLADDREPEPEPGMASADSSGAVEPVEHVGRSEPAMPSPWSSTVSWPSVMRTVTRPPSGGAPLRRVVEQIRHGTLESGVLPTTHQGSALTSKAMPGARRRTRATPQ